MFSRFQQSIGIINEALKDEKYCGLPIDEKYKRISIDCYPFGERNYWPYKAWLSAIKKAKETEVRYNNFFKK